MVKISNFKNSMSPENKEYYNTYFNDYPTPEDIEYEDTGNESKDKKNKEELYEKELLDKFNEDLSMFLSTFRDKFSISSSSIKTKTKTDHDSDKDIDADADSDTEIHKSSHESEPEQKIVPKTAPTTKKISVRKTKN